MIIVFLNQTVPFVVSNIDTSLTPDLENLYQPSVVLEVNNSNFHTISISLPLEFTKRYNKEYKSIPHHKRILCSFVFRLEVERWEWWATSPQRPWRCQYPAINIHHPPIFIIILINIIPIKVSNPGALIINDELEPVAKEVARLEAEGVDIIIGLGHR